MRAFSEHSLIYLHVYTNWSIRPQTAAPRHTGQSGYSVKESEAHVLVGLVFALLFLLFLLHLLPRSGRLRLGCLHQRSKRGRISHEGLRLETRRWGEEEESGERPRATWMTSPQLTSYKQAAWHARKHSLIVGKDKIYTLTAQVRRHFVCLITGQCGMRTWTRGEGGL